MVSCSHLAQRPHERAVDAQELLRVDRVSLVEHDAYLVVVPLERLDGQPELVRDIELVRVEEEQDDVRPRREPLGHLRHVVRALGLG